MRIHVDDFNTSLYSAEPGAGADRKSRSTREPPLSGEQKLILNKVENNYASLNLQSLLHICGGANYFQMYVLCTQIMVAVLQFFSLALVPQLFTAPTFDCFDAQGLSSVCGQEAACKSRFGYSLRPGFIGFPQAFGMECDSSGAMGVTLGYLAIWLALGHVLVYVAMTRLGRSKSYLFCSVMQMWGNIIMCLSVNYTIAVIGLTFSLVGLLVWGLNSVVYLQEIFLGDSRRFAVPLVLCIGSVGAVMASLSTLVFQDFRAILCVLLVFQILSAMTYFQYSESPFFAYRFQTLGEFYASLKFILRINFGMSYTSKRFKALKSVIFNTDDSHFWVSVLISGEVGSIKQLKHTGKPKPKAHFLDDSGIFNSSDSTDIESPAMETLSAQCPSDSDQDLKQIEEKLFNECELRIEPRTLLSIKDIRLKPQTSVQNLFHQTIRSQPLKMAGFAGLLVFNAVGLRASQLSFASSGIMEPIWEGALIASALFIGFFLSAVLPKIAQPRDMNMLSAVSMLFLFINFITAEYNFKVSPFMLTTLSDPFLSLLAFQSVIFVVLFAFNISILFNFAMETFDSVYRLRVLVLASALAVFLVGLSLFPGVLLALSRYCLLNVFLLGLIPYTVIAYLMPAPLHKGIFN